MQSHNIVLIIVFLLPLYWLVFIVFPCQSALQKFDEICYMFDTQNVFYLP